MQIWPFWGDLRLLSYGVEAESDDGRGFKTRCELELPLQIPALVRFQGNDEPGFLTRFEHLFGMADYRKLWILRFYLHDRNRLGGHVSEPEGLCGGGIDLHVIKVHI